MVRAKFRVLEVKQQIDAYSKESAKSEVVVLAPVHGKGNELWSKWTPSGRIEMHITNPAAVEQLKLGDTFYVDFTPAPATEPEPAPAEG